MRTNSLCLLALIVGACSSAPKPADPPRLKAALEAESDGAKRYARGDYAAATRRFEEAFQLQAGIDNKSGVLRNRLHLARTELALGRAESAMILLTATDSAGDAGLMLDTLLLKAQAQLALSRIDDAQQYLNSARELCLDACPQSASLRLMLARAALGGQRAAEALTHAEAALKLLEGKDEANETGNAMRVIAAARLAAGDTSGALAAAKAALDIDRRLALPEKIARDWLLIGDIQLASGNAPAAAYRRALDVANAANLPEISTTIKRALNDIGMEKKHSP